MRVVSSIVTTALVIALFALIAVGMLFGGEYRQCRETAENLHIQSRWHLRSGCELSVDGREWYSQEDFVKQGVMP